MNSNDPNYVDDFAIWAEQMDAAYQDDPSNFDKDTGRVIETMLSGEPVDDMNKLQDEYEAAVVAYKEIFEDMDVDYEAYLEDAQFNYRY